MTLTAQRRIVLIASLALLVLHSDDLLFGHATGVRPAVLGWLPADMAYHLVWTVAGIGVCWMALSCTWGRSR